MINPKNKRVMITLTEESTQLLNSLSTRYNKSKSEIIKWALNVLAAKKRHNLIIKLREQINNEDLYVDENDPQYLELMKKYENR